MKISVFISAMLVVQVSASFFDVFQGAVLSVQNSFGKLLSDVVTDVKETVDCTILAVEHVLSLSNDATARYNEKCGSGTNKTDSAKPDGSVPKVEINLEISNNEEYLQKEIPAEIDAQINKTLSKVLGNYNPHETLLSVESVLAQESEKLVNVGDLVKQELEKLSNEVNSDFKKMNQSSSEPSVDTILQEIKLLEKKEHAAKNASEADEIHQVIDEVLDKLDAIEATEATENVKLEDILKDLENKSNTSFAGLRQQFEEWKEEESRHLGEIKYKMEEHEKFGELSGYIYDRHKSLSTQPVQNPANITLTDKENSSIDEMINETTSTPPMKIITPENTLSDTVMMTPSLSITNNTFVTEKNNLFETYTTTDNNEPSNDFNDTIIDSAVMNETTTDPRKLIHSDILESSTLSTMIDSTTKVKLLEYSYRDSGKKEIEAFTSTTIASNAAIHSTNIADGDEALITQNYLQSDSINNTITSITLNQTLNTSEGVTQLVDSTTTLSTITESFTDTSTIDNFTIKKPTTFKQLTEDDDLNATMITNTPLSILENIPIRELNQSVEMTTLAENKDSSNLTTLIDSSNSILTDALFSTIESIHLTTSQPDESTTSLVNDELTTLYLSTNQPTNNPNNENGNTLNEIVNSTPFPSIGGASVLMTTQTEEATTVFENDLLLKFPKTSNDTGASVIPFGIAKRTFTDVSSTPANKDTRADMDSEAQKEKRIFEMLDSLNPNSPDLADEIIAKEINPPTTPIIKKMFTPYQAIDPQKTNYESLPYMQRPTIAVGAPFSLNGPPSNPYRPPDGLTTYRPQTTFPRGNNYKNAPLDYDSFFHIPQRNTDAHDRAIREARQLIENSKLSDKIINNILHHKNNYGARSIFNNPGPLLNLRK